jgi:hypothetical protein
VSAGASIGILLAWMQEVQITHGEVICHSIHGDTHRHPWLHAEYTPPMEIPHRHPWLHAEYTPSMEIKMKSDNFERKLQRMKNNSNLRSMLLMDLHRVG